MDVVGAAGRDGADAGDGEDVRPVIESLILAVAHHWSRRETAGRQTELIERHFSQDEMKAALWKLHRKVDGFDKPKNRVGGAAKTATALQAEDLVKAITELGDQDKLPRFTAQSDDFHRIYTLLSALSISDERSVATRLEALEASQQQNMIELKRLMTASPIQQTPMITVTTPQARVPTPRGGAHVSPGPVTSATSVDTAAGADQPRAKPSYADKAGRAPETAAAGADKETPSFFHRQTRADQRLTPGSRTHRSTSSKRRRLDDDAGSRHPSEETNSQENWQSQGRRRKNKTRPKVNTGRANGEGFLNLEGPAHFWIGNTRADTDSEKVKDVLKRAAANLEIQDFSVEEAICLTKGVAPRTKTWKVSVPARMGEHMNNPEMYPTGWTFRVFTNWSRKSEGKNNPQANTVAADAAAAAAASPNGEALSV